MNRTHFLIRPMAFTIALILTVMLTVACTVPPIQLPTAPATPHPDDDVQTLYVGPELVPCTGVAEMECLQVRESPDEPYSLFYDEIEGFDFEPGYVYELRVRVEEVDDPPADASSLRYTLVEIVDQDSAADFPLESTVWLLQEYAGPDGTLQPAIAESDGFILLENGELGGNAGCNSFFGDYVTDNESLELGTLGSTLMACEEALMEQERAVMMALSATETFRILGDRLTLFDQDGNPVAVFSENDASDPSLGDPESAVPDPAELEAATLEDTRWLLAQYAEDGAMQSAVEDTDAFLLLSDGDVSGHTGCNQFGGEGAYLLEGNSLSFDQVISTLMACMGPVEAQERAFFVALEETRGYRLENGTLALLDGDGAPLLVFAAATESETTLSNDIEAVADEAEGLTLEASLEDFLWNLAAYRDRHGEWVEPVSPGEMTLSGGDLAGNTGCNRMNSAYNTDGDRLSFGAIATTRMGCAPDIAAQEFDVLNGLRQTRGYTLQDETLTLLDEDGEPVLSFVAP